MTTEEHKGADLTPARRAALQLVAEGKVWYSLATGIFEPDEGYRRPAFAWLDEFGYIEPDYEAEPNGRVMRLVPVRVVNR